MIYFLYRSYTPNTASANRSLAYFKNIDKLKIPITVVYFLPDRRRSKIADEYEYVKVKYYWEHYFVSNSKFQFIPYHLSIIYFVKHLKSGDKVYVYGYSDICKIVLSRKDVEVFFEVTESPEVSLPSSPLCRVSLEGHLNLCKRVTKLFVISNKLKDYYASNGIDSTKISVINMIVDPSRFLGLIKTAHNDRYIAYCGTISNNKDGVDILIKAFAIVKTLINDIKLYVIGAPPAKDTANNNVELINQLGLEDSIVYTGLIPYRQLPQMLLNAEILALARPDNLQANFGFPTKLGEYLLTGNPVVVTDVGDITSFLHDGIEVLISPPDDPNAFAERLLWVFNHQEQARQIGERGKKVALTSFNAFEETNKLIGQIM